MLYIFLVDTGTMLTFEMNLAMQRVRELQEVIAREYRIPQEKQVLLISGGDSLDPNERVCRYAAGTDTNPIFLFNKQSLESATSPLVSFQYGSESHLKERLEDSLTLTASYDTLAARTGLAANFHEIAKEDLQVCQRLVFDQHLQHQGWLAVIANLEDVTHAFEVNNKLVFQQFDEFLSRRDENMKLLDRFPAAVELLAKIPLLQSLSLASITSSGTDEQPKTLLAWITAQETNKTLEQMMTKCKSDLEQFEEHTYKNLVQDIESVLTQVDNVSMKEVRGLEGRLFQLDFFMQAAAKLVAEQEQIFKAIENNQMTAIHVQDPTVLPELCEIHKHQMPQMLRNHDQLQEIKNKCRCAKVDLSENLHKRLRWVMYVEKGLMEVNSRIFFYKEMLHRLKHHLEIIRQISTSPEVYGRSVAEVVRRKRFSSEYAKFAKSLSERCGELRRNEMGRRKDFDKFFHCHFFNALFPGFDDIPPSFATKCPDAFDNRLPSLTGQDVVMLSDKVPELVESLRILECPSMSLADLLPRAAADVPPATVSPVGHPLSSSTRVDPAIPDPTPLDGSSQSVEIITAEESRLAALGPAEATVTESSAGEADSAGKEDEERAGSPAGGRASLEALPELEEGNPASDAFMTADFYFDESMPSSMTELVSSKKLAELQCILQDRATQLEQKEREVMDSRRCIDELNTKILLYEKTTKLMNEAVLSCCAPLKQDLEDVRTSVEISRSQSLVELSTVHGNLVELVKTWNMASEQVALDSARSFDESLTAVRVKLDAESELLRSCAGENQKLQLLLGEKSSACTDLGNEVQRLKAENDSYRKAVLELELENEKLHSDYKTDAEAKDDVIKTLRRAVDDTAKSEEAVKKFELEVLSMRDEMKRELVANEARIAEEVAIALSEKHQQELSELRTEFQDRLTEKEEAIKILNDCCRGYIERQKELEMENAGNLAELQKDNDVRLKVEIDKNACISEEMNVVKGEMEKLVAGREEHLRCIEKLNCIVEEINRKLESRKLEERESQTESADLSDMESQTEVATQDVGIQAEIEVAVMVKVDAATYPDEDYPKSLDDVDTQTDALDTHDIEIQAASDTHDVMIQIVPVVRGVEIQTDPVPTSDEMQSGVFSSGLRSNEGAEAFAESTCIDKDKELNITICSYSDSKNPEETFETGICELRSCVDPSVSTETVESEDGFALQLRVDDYLPLQRHDEIVARLKAQMQEEKSAAILRVKEDFVRKFEEEKLLLKANSEARRQIIFNEALNRAVAERDVQIDALQKKILELSSAKVTSDPMSYGKATVVQELSGAKGSVEENFGEESADKDPDACRGQPRPPSGSLPSSGMAVSFVPLTEMSALDRSVMSCSVQSHPKQTVDKFKEKLIELSVSSSISDYLMQYVSISRCKEHDIMFFVWNDTLGHYLAYLAGNQIHHFLHVHSASHIEQQSSDFKALHKWLVGEVIHSELCLAKKETNRFHLPVGTKFFRVKAKPWSPSSEVQPKWSAEDQSRQKRATSSKNDDNKS